MNRIYNAAEEWIFATGWQGDIRFDIITVKIGQGFDDAVIEHHVDAIN